MSFDSTAKQFVTENKNITDVSSLKNHQENANEVIADHFNAVTKGWSDADKERLSESIAKNSGSNDYASFKMNNENHHLMVTTRAFDMPINFGMSQTTDLTDLSTKMAGLHKGGTYYEETAPIYKK